MQEKHPKILFFSPLRKAADQGRLFCYLQTTCDIIKSPGLGDVSAVPFSSPLATPLPLPQ